MDNNKEEWISVSELAENRHVSKQKIYNDIRDGLYEVKRFKRGQKYGMLVRVLVERKESV